MKRKIALVTPRYGLEVNGGAELLARQMAEHMPSDFEIEVLTTKAVDYVTWANEYKNDTEVINGVFVRRFSVLRERDVEEFGPYYIKAVNYKNHTMADERKYFEMQGPYSPALVDYIDKHSDEYDVFVFMTCLYYITVEGLPKVKEKSILISTAHDEPPMYLRTFKQLFLMPKAMYYLTVEEKEFVEKTFGNAHIINNQGHGGCGIEIPKNINPERLKQERNITDYMVYAGRIDEQKGCVKLFEYFERYKRENNNNLKLVLMGKAVVPIPENKDIISLGFVSEQKKFDVIAGARFMVMPSAFESLSIAILEAMALSVPVLVNARCEVLRGHCLRSNAGLYFRSYYEFEGCVNYMLNNPDVAEIMSANAKQYVKDNYTWDKIMSDFSDIVERVVK